jgi:hypothetical protein
MAILSPNEATVFFNATQQYDDLRFNFIERHLGLEAILAEEATFARFMEDLGDEFENPALTAPLYDPDFNEVVNKKIEFEERACALFGMVSGYALNEVEVGYLSLHRDNASIHSVIALCAELTEQGGIYIRKTFYESPLSSRFQDYPKDALEVTAEDTSSVLAAVAKLDEVNCLLEAA